MASRDAFVMGLNKVWRPECQLKCSPNYITLMALVRGGRSGVRKPLRRAARLAAGCSLTLALPLSLSPPFPRQSTFQPVVEWPLPLVKRIACDGSESGFGAPRALDSTSDSTHPTLHSVPPAATDKFMVEGWVERRRRAGLFVMETAEAGKIFQKAAKYIHDYTVRAVAVPGSPVPPASVLLSHGSAPATGQAGRDAGPVAAEGRARGRHGH